MQNDELPVLGGQLADGLLDVLRYVKTRIARRGEGHGLGATPKGHTFEELLPNEPPAVILPARVDGDSREPTAQGAFTTKTAAMDEGVHKYFLQGILRFLMVR